MQAAVARRVRAGVEDHVGLLHAGELVVAVRAQEGDVGRVAVGVLPVALAVGVQAGQVLLRRRGAGIRDECGDAVIVELALDADQLPAVVDLAEVVGVGEVARGGVVRRAPPNRRHGLRPAAGVRDHEGGVRTGDGSVADLHAFAAVLVLDADRDRCPLVGRRHDGLVLQLDVAVGVQGQLEGQRLAGVRPGRRHARPGGGGVAARVVRDVGPLDREGLASRHAGRYTTVVFAEDGRGADPAGAAHRRAAGPGLAAGAAALAAARGAADRPSGDAVCTGAVGGGCVHTTGGARVEVGPEGADQVEFGTFSHSAR